MSQQLLIPVQTLSLVLSPMMSSLVKLMVILVLFSELMTPPVNWKLEGEPLE